MLAAAVYCLHISCVHMVVVKPSRQPPKSKSAKKRERQKAKKKAAQQQQLETQLSTGCRHDARLPALPCARACVGSALLKREVV
jgi:hypothetical protein